MYRAVLPALLLLPLAAAAQAQPAPQRHAPAPRSSVRPAPPPVARAPAPSTPEQDAVARCRALPGQLSETAGVEALADGGCRFTRIRFGLLGGVGYEVDTLTEHGLPSDLSAVPDKPLDVRIEARGIVFAPRSGSAGTDWMIRQQQVPFDVTLEADYEPARREGTVRKLSLDGAALGQVSLAVAATGLDPAAFPQGAALRSVRLHMDSRRFLLTFALAPLASTLPEDDPGGAVDRAKAQVIDTLRTLLPGMGASTGTVDALAGFVADFPRPQHVLDLDVTADPPLGADTVAALLADPAQASTLLKGVAITATYAGDPR